MFLKHRQTLTDIEAPIMHQDVLLSHQWKIHVYIYSKIIYSYGETKNT